MQILRRIPYWTVVALLVYMPFHIFLAQSLSLWTGGLDVWKMAKDIFLAVAIVFTICLVWQQGKSGSQFNILLGLGTTYFGLHIVLWVLNADIYHDSAVLGVVYNTRLLAFVVLGYGAMLLYPSKFVFSSLLKIILVVSSIVALLGVMQYFLPKDILSHLGYSLDRGARPAFFIDDNPAFPRIMSTLREPNALGAYLVLPFAALTWLALRSKDSKGRFFYIGTWVLHAVALYLTFSRSAWLAAGLAIGLIVWWALKGQIKNMYKKFWPIAAGLFLVLGASAILMRDTSFFQHYIMHGNPKEQTVDLDSNDYHTLLLRQGLHGIADKPVGHGPGTAGLVSIQNPNGGQLTENYYVQIGYELGVAGLLLFLVINVWIFLNIWRRSDYIAAILCASFCGYIVTNMLLHSWGNEAVAAQWWILAGIALAMPISSGDGGRTRATKKPEAS